MPQPAHLSVFTGNTRGYWFTAPTCFTLTGVQVPTDASSGAQNVAIMRFQTNPPSFSATTNVFDTLFVTQNSPISGIIPLNIVINQGDIIGVLASRGTANSYAPSPYISSINGIPVTLNRLGMQFPLATNLPQNLWSEASGSISRCWLYYDSTVVNSFTTSNVGASYTFTNNTDTLYTSMYTIWNYGDGSPLDTNHIPTHIYTANGTYNVCSYLYTACGIDTFCSSINVCFYNPTAGFTNTTNNLEVTITDTSSNATSWFYDFGDGDTSNLQNPIHTYATEGWYEVTQISINSCGLRDTIVDSIFVCIPPNSYFTYTEITSANIQFTDTSDYATSWAWDFGDGGSSILQNPTHMYTVNGNYNVCLIVNSLCGADTNCINITVCPEVFTAGYSNTNTAFTANFTNSSVGSTSYNWDFGDGNSSSSASPTHVYASGGEYFVCLTAYNLCGDSTQFCDSVSIAGNSNIEEANLIPSFDLYPNPASTIVSMNMNFVESVKGRLYISDITGKIIHTIKSGDFATGQFNYTLNIEEYKNGLYLVVFESDSIKTTKKLLKVRP